LADAAQLVTLVVVSPHLDDAVLCAGGGMAIARSLGVDVLMVTIFAGGVRTDRLGNYARAFHQQCGLGDGAIVAVRRHEDAVAATALDVRYQWLDVPDALYRTGDDGPLYDSDAKLFGEPVDSDDKLGADARALLSQHIQPADVVLLPLSVGRHVDHVLARRWGESAARDAGAHCIHYYEESLYEDQNGATSWRGVDTGGLERLEVSVPASRREIKELAVCAYRSQLVMLGLGPDHPGERAMFMARLGLEKYWQPIVPTRRLL